jgi:hypothetical protein
MTLASAVAATSVAAGQQALPSPRAAAEAAVLVLGPPDPAGVLVPRANDAASGPPGAAGPLGGAAGWMPVGEIEGTLPRRCGLATSVGETSGEGAAPVPAEPPPLPARARPKGAPEGVADSLPCSSPAPLRAPRGDDAAASRPIEPLPEPPPVRGGPRLPDECSSGPHSGPEPSSREPRERRE